MARGITEQDVFEAADSLLARGERPTIERVRQQLGRGSPNTGNRPLDAWWASLARRVQGKSGSALPASLLDLCRRLYEGMKTQAADEARVIAAVGEQSQKEDRANVERMVQAVESEKAAIAATVEKLREDLKVLGIRNEMLVADRARLTSELEASRKEDESHRRRIGELVADLEKAQVSQQAEAARIREQWQGSESRWLKEIEHLRDDAKRVRAEHESQLKALREQLKASQRDFAVVLKARGALSAELARRENLLAKERDARVAAEAASRATRTLVRELKQKRAGSSGRPARRVDAGEGASEG